MDSISEETHEDENEFDLLEVVGNIDAVEGQATRGEVSSMSKGCFELQSSQTVEASEASESVSDQGAGEEDQLSKTVSKTDGSYFAMALEQKCEVFEIYLDIQARDVHKHKNQGRDTWVLNEKPKKRAEVQFRSLNDDDKLDFMKTMQNELGSYLEHEAVAIARRHNVPPERILGMRWVLTWKVIENEQGHQTGQKPKARLIIKGHQDPDLLFLKRDSPTLSTQNRNMVLALTACNHWHAYVGDIKTAFLNGDKTEIDREIFAEPPEEVRRMLNMKDSELFRIQTAVYGLLHAPRAWADKLAQELGRQGWIQSKLEPCVWRLYDEDHRLCRLIGVHVDDVLCCGRGSMFDQKVEQLKASFPLGAWKSLAEPTTFCGCELRQREDFSIELNQESTKNDTERA